MSNTTTNPEPETKSFDHVGFIIALECGECDQEELIAGMQQLINSGLAYRLQGSYGRLADQLIKAGLCERPVNS